MSAYGLLGPNHIGMTVNPEYPEFSIVFFVQVADRHEIDYTVTDERDDAVQFVDMVCCPRRTGLLKKGCAPDNAVLYLKGRIVRLEYVDRLFWAVISRGKLVKQMRAVFS